MGHIVGLDIGGTNCRVVAATEAGTELARFVVPTNCNNPISTLAAINTGMAQHSWPKKFSFTAAAGAVAGNVQSGVLVDAGNLSAWRGTDLAEAFRHLFGCPAAVLNDCAAAALGEYAALQQPLVYVIWGTGVGAAVINASGEVKPTELGHMVIQLGSKHRCGCGGYGHLEALVGGGNLAVRFKLSRVQEMTDRQWTKVLTEMAAGLRNISCGEIGLPIILGGGVTHNQVARLPELQQLVASLAAPVASPSLSFPSFGEDSGLHGALEAARRLLDG